MTSSITTLFESEVFDLLGGAFSLTFGTAAGLYLRPVTGEPYRRGRPPRHTLTRLFTFLINILYTYRLSLCPR